MHYKTRQFRRFFTKSGNTQGVLVWPSAYTYELFKLRYLSDSGIRIVTFEINISKITWIDFYCCWQLGLFWPNVRAWWIRFVLTFAWLIYRFPFLYMQMILQSDMHRTKFYIKYQFMELCYLLILHFLCRDIFDLNLLIFCRVLAKMFNRITNNCIKQKDKII